MIMFRPREGRGWTVVALPRERLGGHLAADTAIGSGKRGYAAYRRLSTDDVDKSARGQVPAYGTVGGVATPGSQDWGFPAGWSALCLAIAGSSSSSAARRSPDRGAPGSTR